MLHLQFLLYNDDFLVAAETDCVHFVINVILPGVYCKHFTYIFVLHVLSTDETYDNNV